MTTLANAITKSLLAKMPTEVANKFDIDQDEFKTFLQEYLTTQFGKTGKGGRTGGVKGKNGKGRISGYILFSNENREKVKEENPEFKFTEVGRELGQMWSKLSDAQKGKWNERAVTQNTANGLPAPTPTPAKTAAKKAASSGEITVTRNQEAKAWVVEGTSFVVQSAKNKTVVGKLRGNKTVALTTADIKKCQAQGWTVKPAPAKGKSKRTVEESDDDSE